MILKEFLEDDDVEVKYQTPEDIEASQNDVALHDDHEEGHGEEKGCCGDDNKVKFVVKGIEDGDKFKLKFKKSSDDEEEDDENEEEEVPMINGRDAINMMHADPANVTVAKYEGSDKYFVDYRDVDAYMEAANIDTFEDALNNIIEANSDCDVDADNIVVVCPENASEIFDESYIDTLENSDIQFII